MLKRGKYKLNRDMNRDGTWERARGAGTIPRRTCLWRRPTFDPGLALLGVHTPKRNSRNSYGFTEDAECPPAKLHPGLDWD